MAKALHVKYCREHNKDTWRSIYEQEDDFSSLASCSIREAYDPKVREFLFLLAFLYL